MFIYNSWSIVSSLENSRLWIPEALLGDPECQLILVEQSGVKVPAEVSVTLEISLLMLQARRSAFGLVSAVNSCTCTSTHTHTQTLIGTICSTSPVTGPRYRSIIYLKPLSLRIRSRFRPIMAILAQHPASIKPCSKIVLLQVSPFQTNVYIIWKNHHLSVKIDCWQEHSVELLLLISIISAFSF